MQLNNLKELARSQPSGAAGQCCLSLHTAAGEKHTCLHTAGEKHTSLPYCGSEEPSSAALYYIYKTAVHIISSDRSSYIVMMC